MKHLLLSIFLTCCGEKLADSEDAVSESVLEQERGDELGRRLFQTQVELRFVNHAQAVMEVP